MTAESKLKYIKTLCYIMVETCERHPRNITLNWAYALSKAILKVIDNEQGKI